MVSYPVRGCLGQGNAVVTHVLEENDAAMELYRKIGFEKAMTLKDHIRSE